MPMAPDYADLLTDELAPFGFVFVRSHECATDKHKTVTFAADPESFVTAYDAADIEDSYGDAWPPDALTLSIDVDPDGDVTRIVFETHDLLDWAAANEPELAARMNSLIDPVDQAQAVGEALAAILAPAAPSPFEDW